MGTGASPVQAERNGNCQWSEPFFDTQGDGYIYFDTAFTSTPAHFSSSVSVAA